MTPTPGSVPDLGPDASPAPRWRWFAAWAVVGLLVPLTLLGAFTIGPYALVVAVVLTVVLARIRSARGGVVGLVCGFGLPLLWVAYLNRSGPGQVCVSTATSGSCEDQWSPWPWLVLGLAPVVAGVLLFRRQRSRARAGSPQPAGQAGA